MARAQNLSPRIHTLPIRQRLGMTQQAFADSLGVARTTVLNWERQGLQPSAPVLPGMAKLVGCSIEDLYDTLPAHD